MQIQPVASFCMAYNLRIKFICLKLVKKKKKKQQQQKKGMQEKPYVTWKIKDIYYLAIYRKKKCLPTSILKTQYSES